MSNAAPEKERGGDETGEGDLVEAFLSTYDRFRTQKSYRHDLRDIFGDEDLTPDSLEVRPEKIREHLLSVAREKGKSAFKRRSAALRSFFRWAEEEDHLSAGRAERAVEATDEAASKLEKS